MQKRLALLTLFLGTLTAVVLALATRSKAVVWLSMMILDILVTLRTSGFRGVATFLVWTMTAMLLTVALWLEPAGVLSDTWLVLFLLVMFCLRIWYVSRYRMSVD